jgi:hypothetical protein
VGQWWRQRFGTDEIPGWVIPSVAGWGLLLLVLGATAALAWRRRSQALALTGPPATFLLLGAWLCCFHFMYYDVLLAAFPVCLLFVEPGRDLGPTRLRVVHLPVLTRSGQGEKATGEQASLHWKIPPPGSLLWRCYRQTWVWNSVAASLVLLLLLTQPLRQLQRLGSPFDQPWDTFCLLALWLWCGRLWLQARPSDPAGSVVRAP